ncbi:hypothetical protein J6590_070787 [Homalodisca vitripennis]|nr:hypothetical protein J6590_070787 [Homalodisca vitripennis]
MVPFGQRKPKLLGGGTISDYTLSDHRREPTGVAPSRLLRPTCMCWFSDADHMHLLTTTLPHTSHAAVFALGIASSSPDTVAMLVLVNYPDYLVSDTASISVHFTYGTRTPNTFSYTTTTRILLPEPPSTKRAPLTHTALCNSGTAALRAHMSTAATGYVTFELIPLWGDLEPAHLYYSHDLCLLPLCSEQILVNAEEGLIPHDLCFVPLCSEQILVIAEEGLIRHGLWLVPLWREQSLVNAKEGLIPHDLCFLPLCKKQILVYVDEGLIPHDYAFSHCAASRSW